LGVEWHSYIVPVLLGLGLAAATGLRTFLPLLMAAASARFGLFGVELSGPLAWLASDAALVALGLAATLEFAGDKLPVVDHALDLAGTVARPLAGALAAAAVFAPGMSADPVTLAIAGLIVGAPAALAVHGAKAGTRVAANAGTAGLAAPAVSLAEDGLTLGAVLLALAAPLLVPLLLAVLLWLGWRVLRRRRRAQASGA
jgi:hypothetical protein